MSSMILATGEPAEMERTRVVVVIAREFHRLREKRESRSEKRVAGICDFDRTAEEEIYSRNHFYNKGDYELTILCQSW